MQLTPLTRRPAFPSRAAALTLVALTLSLAACKPAGTPPAAPPTPSVGVWPVETSRVVLSTELPGRTSARLVAEVRPQINGIVQARLFEEGATVKAGQVLYQIDPATYQAAFQQAQASVARAEAQVNATRLIAQRNAELIKASAVSQQNLDDAQTAYLQAQADLQVARAAQETARINLERTRITSPISGRADLSAITPGALVVANQAQALTTVQQTDPMLVDVVQPSAEVLRLRREARDASRNADEVPVRLLLEDGSVYPLPGRLSFQGVAVGKGTDSVTLRATVPNPQGLLMPGMYVRAVLDTGVQAQAVSVPQQGVSRSPTGEAVALVVGADNKVERRPLKVDRALGNRWLVREGLQPGDLLIVEGHQKVRPGAEVKVQKLTLESLEKPPAKGAAPSAAASGTDSARPPAVGRTGRSGG